MDDKLKAMGTNLGFGSDTDGKRQVFEISPNFGLLLKHQRELKNLSLKELEEISGTSASYINRLERFERTSPSITKCFALAEALDIPYYMLLTTAFAEAAKAQESQMSIAELLITNECLVNGELIKTEAKYGLIKIIEYLLACTWEEERVEELFELAKLVGEFKKAV